MADYKGRKRGSPMTKTWGFFLVAQDMVLSHRAKFQLIINFFRVKAISTELGKYKVKFASNLDEDKPANMLKNWLKSSTLTLVKKNIVVLAVTLAFIMDIEHPQSAV